MIVSLKKYDADYGVWIAKHVGTPEIIRIAIENVARSEEHAHAMVPGFYRMSNQTLPDGNGVYRPISLIKL